MASFPGALGDWAVAGRLDPETANAAKAGDVNALNAVLACSRQDLRRYAEYHCEVDDVEDAVQEMLLRAIHRSMLAEAG